MPNSPYSQNINVAQINDALQTYAGQSTITDGLAAMKTAIIAGIASAADCVQCGATGKVDAGASICPLCSGMTKTSGQYKIQPSVVTYVKL